MPWQELLGDPFDRPWGRSGNLILLRSVDSTNSLARRLACGYQETGGQPPRCLIVAYEQTEGRGRFRRPWVSQAGQGLYASLLLPLADTNALRLLPIVVATALCRGLENLLPVAAGIKWPNDLLVRGRKIAGILIESLIRGDRAPVAIIGFGVNLRLSTKVRSELRMATSLEEEGAAAMSLADLARALLSSLEDELPMLDSPERAISEYRARSTLKSGDPVRARTASGIVEGEFVGFDRLGRLELTTSSGSLRLDAGEVEARFDRRR